MNMMKKHKTYKGKYSPKFPKKYKGNYNNIIYRSLWERKCMVYFDTNSSILAWSSEELAIPYFDTISKQRRRYYPDFLITVKDNTGKEKVHLIEVKPSKDLKPPVITKGKRKSTILYEAQAYYMNRDKFAAAEKWCAKKDIKFSIWTEKELLF
jgi:hypothetical protein|tara:strand:+ start:305 stop:763 length:459 start_codon:yes stop_codon:yes gene_type:complete